jgi:hypothetical protein
MRRLIAASPDTSSAPLPRKGVPAQFRDLFVEAGLPETRGNSRSQWGLNVFFTPDRIPKDLANLFLRTAAVPASAALELLLHAIVEPTNQQLSHDGTIASPVMLPPLVA